MGNTNSDEVAEYFMTELEKKGKKSQPLKDNTN
jgi:hypothetical protein